MEKIDDCDKLVINDLGQGWEDFCNFLGKEVPNEPWPWVNKGSSMVTELLTNNEEYLKSKK